jgi:hypothetical protein
MNMKERSWQGPKEVESCAVLDPAESSELASLTVDEIASLFGRKSSLVALHWLLASNELQQAALAALLGKAGRRSVRVLNADLTIPSYLRLLSRLCGDAAAQTEQEIAESPFQFGAPETEEPESFSEEAFSQSETRTGTDDETDRKAPLIPTGADAPAEGWPTYRTRYARVTSSQGLAPSLGPMPLTAPDPARTTICSPSSTLSWRTVYLKTRSTSCLPGRHREIRPRGSPPTRQMAN